MQNKPLQRHTAVKILLNDIITSRFIQEDDQNPNYLLFENWDKLYRVNIIATVVDKEQIGSITNIMLDDGTGRVMLRSFEENQQVKEVSFGEVVLIIGKVRIYNEEKYISPEIIKKIDPRWLKVRSLELTHRKNEVDVYQEPQQVETNREIIERDQEEQVIEDTLLPFQKISQIIKDLDGGEGVRIEEIIEKSALEGTEKIIEKMLERGDIFQNQPGKVKVL